MRIHRVHLRNFRGIIDREIHFKISGVTIIEGDNEAGKSSLAEAIDLLFEERDDTSKMRVKAVKPVDRDVGAEVEAEVTTGKYHFVYSKRWHKEHFTELQISEPRREQVTGREAHERVKEILAETVDDPLWRALRVPQGEATEQPSWGVDSSLAQALDVAAGGSPDNGNDCGIYARACEERDRYWTSTGRPNVERSNLAKALSDATEEVANATGSLSALETDVALHERLTKEIAALRPERDALSQDREELEDKWRGIEQRRTKVKELAARAELAAGAFARAHDAVGEREALIDEAERRRVALQEIAEEQRRAEPVLQAARGSVTAAANRLEEARDAVPNASADSDRAAADYQHIRDLFDLETLDERHGHVVQAEERIRKADDLLADCLVDDGTLAAIDAAQTQVTGKQAALDASAGFIRAEALRDITLHVGDESVTLIEGQTDERPLAGELELVVGHDARIVVTPGGDARVLGSELAAARNELARLCGSAHVIDLADARRQRSEGDTAEQTRLVEVQRRSENLRDLTLEEIAAKIERLRSAVTRYASTRTEGTPLPENLSAAQRLDEDTSAALRSFQEAVTECELRLQGVTGKHQDLLVGQSALAGRREVSQRELDDSVKRLEDARREMPDADLTQAADDARATAITARALQEEADRALKQENPDAQEILLTNKKAALKRITEEIRDREGDLNAAQARLEVRGEEGLQRSLDEAITRRIALEHERDRKEARAAAALLLHDAMTRYRDTAKQRYIAPFRERIESLARIVFGPDLEVELDDDLRIARRTLDGKTLDWAQLSVGAREQLAIIARLACAAIVSDDEGVPVIFDDALGNTDPGRLERMGAVLSVASTRSQVVVLTCMPDRYRHVGNAAVIRIQN